MAGNDSYYPRRRPTGRRPVEPDPDRPGAMTGIDRLFMAAPDLARRLALAAGEPTDDRSTG